MRLPERLRRLEEAKLASSGRSCPRYLESYLDSLESWRREQDGLPPIEQPYTEEVREEDKATLERTIPAYRSESGWQTEEPKAFLDQWEREVKDRLETNERKDAI